MKKMSKKLHFIPKADKLYSAFLISYIIMFLCTLFIGVVFYITSFNFIRQSVEELNLKSIQLSKNTLDGYVKDVVHLAASITENPYNVELSMLNRIDRPNDIYKASKFIASLANGKINNRIIKTIYVYYPKSDLVISTEGMFTSSFFYDAYTRQSALDYEEWKARFLENSAGFSDAQTIDNGYYSQQVVEYSRQFKSVSDFDSFGYVCIVLDNEQIGELLAEINVYSHSDIYIVNSDDKIITSAGTNLLVDYIPQDYIVNKIVKSGEYGKIHVFSDKSYTNNWRYIVLVPEKYYFERMDMVRAIIMITIAGQLIIGIGLTFVFSRRNYKPILRLSENISKVIGLPDKTNYSMDTLSDIEQATISAIHESREIKKRLTDLKPTLDNYFITQLLSGTYYKMKYDEYLNELPDYFKNKSIVTAKIFIDDCSSFVKDYSIQEIALVKLVIINILEETFDSSKLLNIYAMDFDIENIVAIIMIDNELDREAAYASIKSMIMNVQTNIVHLFAIYTDIGISAGRQSIEFLRDAYSEASTALDYRIINGPGSINCFADINNENDFKYSYNLAMETKLINNLKSGDFVSVSQTLDEIFKDKEEPGKQSVEMTKCLMADMACTAFKVIAELHIPYDNESLLIHNLLKSETLTAMKKDIYKAYEDFCSFINKHKKSHNIQLKERILEYLDSNYLDSNLSLVGAADELGLNSTYLSCFFKEQVGDTFINYILGLRIAKAKELLKTTNMPVQKIAEEVGYASGAVFIRVFKKNQGQTPGKYREGMHEGD